MWDGTLPGGSGGPGRDRTEVLAVMSRPLYRLSYRAMNDIVCFVGLLLKAGSKEPDPLFV